MPGPSVSEPSTRRPVCPGTITSRCGAVSDAKTTQPAAIASSSEQATGYDRLGAMCKSLAASTSAMVLGTEGPRNQSRSASRRTFMRQQVSTVIAVVKVDVEPASDDRIADDDAQNIASCLNQAVRNQPGTGRTREPGRAIGPRS